MNKKQKSTICDVVVVGDVLVDNLYWVNTIPLSGCDEMILRASRQSGGSASNTSVILNALGVNCCFCGTIGDDEIGREIAHGMEAAGIDLRCLQKGSGKTGYTLTLVEPSGERTMLSYRDSSADPLKMTEEVIQAVTGAQVLLFSGYLLSTSAQTDFVFQLARLARENQTLVMLDTSPIIGKIDQTIIEEMLTLTDVLMPNKQELLTLSQTDNVDDGIQLLLHQVPAIVVKLGSDGARLVTRDGCHLPRMQNEGIRMNHFARANSIEPKDTTGAGDSFNAGFIASFLRSEAPSAWLAFGNEIAARVVTEKMCRNLIMQ